MNKKVLGTVIGAGVTYLMRNKSARDKLISTVRNFASSRQGSVQRPAAQPADRSGSSKI
ncbi:hypothetical protein ACTHPH_02655 [Paenibacillus pasadenensis]|uniref:Uncharacterized protein n=1 Tax=Paenibacillus pasadenensis TaxID=217090 RepID=A0A2N5N6T8_9BACL|nr:MULTISPECIES: hypothetical protein [Paenibacillus]PLT46071.1 hypothetical protein B8V81_4502 [Paenibacillus pasadenensis]QGG56547.1 hypothetical protein GE073_13795 [Paenibacillus sp. B01]